MTQIATNSSASASGTSELWSIFDARRVKAPELKGLDAMVNGMVGWAKNRRPMLRLLRAQAARVEKMEVEVHALGATQFRAEVEQARQLARLGRLDGTAMDRAVAVVREGCWRAIDKRPYPVQIMGALAMCSGAIAEMATGEGKTITAALAASIWAWSGRPVHIITVNDYLVARDAEEMSPIYKMLGHTVGHIVHETSQGERIDHYRRNVVYCTSKELVADFLRDQIALGNLRTATQTSVTMMLGNSQVQSNLMVPGLFRAIVDEADSILIDEAVTPLIISNAPEVNPNASLYYAADELAQALDPDADFTIDWTTRNIDLTARGHRHLDELVDARIAALESNDALLHGDPVSRETADEGLEEQPADDNAPVAELIEQPHESVIGFWKGRRRREELVTMSLTARYCYVRDEQYLVDGEGKIAIIDEFTGRVMADRSWRHGLHQAIEVKEGVVVTSDKENLARISFQRFFRQYRQVAGMTGTAWEAASEIWKIYHIPVIRIPTNKPCIRQVLPIRVFGSLDKKWEAVIDRVCELNDQGIPVLVGTRSVLASEEVSRRLTERQRPHQVLNAAQNMQEAFIVSQAGQAKQITVATNMAGRGTDIKLGRGVAESGGLAVISTEPHGSGRVDRQLYGRAARQGDPGTAQMLCCLEDDLFIRHARYLRHLRPMLRGSHLIKHAQSAAERLAFFNRKQVLKSDDWMDEALPF